MRRAGESRRAAKIGAPSGGGFCIMVLWRHFGAQGDLPAHQEVLDWLAVQMIESGWDVKATMRRMVTSATYRQQSAAPPALTRRTNVRPRGSVPAAGTAACGTGVLVEGSGVGVSLGRGVGDEVAVGEAVAVIVGRGVAVLVGVAVGSASPPTMPHPVATTPATTNVSAPGRFRMRRRGTRPA